MKWNMASEAISIVIICIIWVYSRKGNPTPSLKNRIFQICLLATFVSMSMNLLSTVLIYRLRPEILLLTWISNLIYFIATPLMGMVYFFYTLSNIYEDSRRLPVYLLYGALPAVIYVIIILTDPLTGAVFNLSLENGYTQGPWISVTYVVFYVYCLACMFFTLFHGQRLTRAIRTVLFAFPFGAGVVIIIQMYMPSVVLSGSAATCSLLLIYLFLQNKQLCIDHLTKVPNRQEFLKMLELSLKQRTQFTLLVISLREFSRINDIHGQHNGDAMLEAVSKYLRSKPLGLKESEIYRYSGDEFALLLHKADLKRLEELIAQITLRFANPWDTESCTCMLSPAIGVTSCPETSDVLVDLIRGLEYAVIRAKMDSAGNYICFCTPELLKQARRRQDIVELLRQNVQNGGFDVYFQPIYGIKADQFVIAEALLRLNDTPLGNISPGEFIPIAEESGLIIDMTYLMLEKVCKRLGSLLEQGLNFGGISVNFSPLQFTQRDLIPRFLEILERNHIPFSKIKVEITESALIENEEIVTEYINQMHELGIRIGLDDFGTGYSNLVSVLKLPFDTIKLDKSLVWSAITDRRFAILVQNLTRAMRELGMCILAEGVEDEAQRQFVVDCGCHYIQGFYYARPMPGDTFADFMLNPVPVGR